MSTNALTECGCLRDLSSTENTGEPPPFGIPDETAPLVLLVSVLFPPAQGGVEAAGGEFARILPELGFRVVVATTTPNAGTFGGIDARILPKEGFPARVSALSREIKPDLILLNGLFLTGGMGLPFEPGSALHVPVVYRAHGFSTIFRFYWRRPPCFGMLAFLRSFIRALRNDHAFGKFSQTVFLDDSIGFFQNFDILLARLFHPHNVSFIPNSFPSLLRHGENSFRKKYGLPIDKPLFLCVANYCERKGQCDSVRIIRRDPGIDATFVFVGSVKNETYAEAKRLAANDTRIRILADIPRNDVVEAVNGCDAAFLFARQEQQPIFLSEAMSCAKPWFSTDVGSVSKMQGGLILRRRTAKCFLAAVNELLSADERRDLGMKGKAFWDANYAPQTIYSRWKRLLGDAVSGKTRNLY